MDGEPGERHWQRQAAAQWASEMKLNSGDPGVEVHEICCAVSELMVTYDQLHVGNSAAAKKVARDL